MTLTSNTPFDKLIPQMAGTLSHSEFPTASRAALRRMVPGQPPPLIFYRFATDHLPDHWDYSPESRQNWTIMVAGMALMAPTIHDPTRSLGQALAESRFAESRLETLFAASGALQRFLIFRMVRFLALQHQPCNWLDIAYLLVTEQPDKRERLYRRIAQDFYRTISSTG